MLTLRSTFKSILCFYYSTFSSYSITFHRNCGLHKITTLFHRNKILKMWIYFGVNKIKSKKVYLTIVDKNNEMAFLRKDFRCCSFWNGESVENEFSFAFLRFNFKDVFLKFRNTFIYSIFVDVHQPCVVSQFTRNSRRNNNNKKKLKLGLTIFWT